MIKGRVTKIQRFSVHDGPGIRTTVFFQGCPLSCAWCQNPENIRDRAEVMYNEMFCAHCCACLKGCPRGCFTFKEKIFFNSTNCDQCGRCLEICPTGSLQWSSKEMSADEILLEVVRDKGFYDFSGGGVTFSGGEPLRQLEFCKEIAAKVKTKGIKIAIDTSGYVSFNAFIEIMHFIDLFLFDIKIFDETDHKKYTGQSNRLILDNFRRLCETDKPMLVRVPLIPGINDQEENLYKIHTFVENCRRGVEIEHVPFNVLIKNKYQMIGKYCQI